MSRKTTILRKNLSEAGYELLYPTGPIRKSSSDFPAEAETLLELADPNEVLRAWYTDSDEISISIEYLKEYIRDNGPFVGILGFSQGAGVASGLINQYSSTFSTDPLKFAIFFGGIKLAQPSCQSWYEPEIAIPTLHVLGELDVMVEHSRSERLINACSEAQRTVLIHGGGHFIPNNRSFVKKVVDWVNDQS